MSEKLFNVGIKGIIVRDNKVLIVKTPKGLWEVPGGRMDANETIKETLLRELKEELPNIQNVKIGDITGATRVHKDIKEDVSLVLVFYKVTADFAGGEPQLSDEHSAYRWATLSEAKETVYDKYQEAIENVFNA